MTKPKISVVLLSYNRPGHLLEALDSVMRQESDELDLDVVVVDNRSPASDRVAEIVAAFPSVRFLPQERNLGFTGGMNIGLRAVDGNFIHLTEDDIVLGDGFYRALVPFALSRSRALYSGVIYDRISGQCVFAGAKLEMGHGYIQDPLKLPTGKRAPFSSGMLLGSMVFGSREAFGEVGEFREEFFMYFEDAEYSWRARLRGITLWIVPKAVGWHTAPASSDFRPLIEFHLLRNYLAINLLYQPALPLVWIVTKFFVYTSVRKAVHGRSFGLLIQVWSWAIIHSWRYLWERIYNIRSDLQIPTEL